MTLEISPVLAGTFDNPNYAPAATSTIGQSQSQQTDNIGSVDTRRYTKFDRSASQVGDATDFSFSDFIDMINPLQHIPVASSVYREITDEKINPVSRVVGDAMYGGLLGVASAIMGGLGAAGDAFMEEQTGKDVAGNVVAALFGTDSPASPAATTQLAQAGSGNAVPASTPSLPAPPSVPALPNTAMASASGVIPLAGLTTTASAQGIAPKNTTPISAANAQAQMQALLAAKSFPVDPAKMAFGGVMDPSSLQGGNMALSLAANAPGLQMGNTVYPGRFTQGIRHTAAGMPVPPGSPAVSPSAASSSAPAAAAQGQISASQSPLPPALMQDIASLRAVNQYKNTASQSTPAGSSVNVLN